VDLEEVDRAITKNGIPLSKDEILQGKPKKYGVKEAYQGVF